MHTTHPTTHHLRGTRESVREGYVTASFTLLRLVAGLLFLQAGSTKLLGWFGGIPPNGTAATLGTQAWIGGLIEVVGGALVMIGLGTRVVAFILSGEMAVAYFQFHQPNGTWPIQNQGQQAVLFCFIWLFVAAYGAGEWSLDALLRKKGPGQVRN